jgi:HTH-type transcriptional regulator/antitoxin HigA
MATAIANDRYLQLVRAFPLRPIRNATMYKAAQQVLDKLAVRDEKSLDQDEHDYLSVLVDLVEAYDKLHAPMPMRRGTPMERLKYVLHESETSQADLQRILGVSQAAVSMILAGKRGLSKSSIQRLAAHFKLNPGYFI